MGGQDYDLHYRRRRFHRIKFRARLLAACGEPVRNLDRLTYAGNPHNLAALALLRQYRPRAIVHFAAESRVDRSIADPAVFVATNINGTFALLEAARLLAGPNARSGGRLSFPERVHR